MGAGAVKRFALGALGVIMAGILSAQESAPAAPPDVGAKLEAFAQELNALRASHDIPGLSVAIVKNGEVIFARGFGHANLELQVPATPETPYNIASVSKPISAVVALKLVELGRLDLDRPLTSYEGFAEFCQEFSGQPSIFAQDLHCDRPMTLRTLLSHTAKGTPGESFFYNPVLYSWASRPMAQAGGQPFSSLVEQYVFRPAGMTRSTRIHRTLPLPPNLAAELAPPYHTDAAGELVPSTPPPPQGDGAAGGVISTVLDLAKFDIALDQGRLISSQSRELMMTSVRSASGAPLPYGLGWFIESYRGHKLVWHSGWWEQAYSALYLKVPEEHLTLILLANSEGIWWNNPLDRAEVEKSPFASAFLNRFGLMQ